ncbi:MAG TPA: hypothetical protein VMZ27_14860 [Candidatus Saccharimonadales bacterium]|nr:hypothetical protein [Candidatus Saccharimonadales bacterium]
MRFTKLNAILFAGNLILLSVAGYLFYSQPWAKQVNAAPEQEVASVPDKKVEAGEPPPPTIVTVTNNLSWAQLESEDYRAYIARLRAIGCPEQTIRDIIIADLDKLIAPRVQSIHGRRQELKYWQPEEEELANNSNPAEVKKKQREIDRQKRQIIMELLGVDLVRERMKQVGQEDYYERRLGFLPEEKRSQLRQVLDKYDEQEQTFRQKEWEGGESLSAADAANLKLVRAQKQAEIAKLLSPAEQEQYELWLSPTANAVRHSVYGMEATEAEFQSIYNVRKALDEQFADADPAIMDEATRLKYEQARKDSEEQIRKALGDKRYTEYKRGEDEEFHYLNTVVSRYNLPRETAANVYDVNATATDMRKAVEADPKLTADQRLAALKGISEETERTLKQMMGTRAFESYRKRSQASAIP